VNSAHLEYCASPQWRQVVEGIILPEALRDADLGANVIEIGPGPGFTTDVLMSKVDRLTAVEVDPELASSLKARLAGSNVRVVRGDASFLDFGDKTFTGAASFHMLHHIETAEVQNRVLAELLRVLRTGGTLVAADGVWNEGSKAFHEGDIYNPIEPGDLEQRLYETGFTSVVVRSYDPGWVCTAVAS
jgi:SAM-dependent methyltransferase